MSEVMANLAGVLLRCRRVLITTHVRPDGDALGTAAAMGLGLRQRGIASDVLLLSKLPSKYAWVMQENAIEPIVSDNGDLPPVEFASYDAVLVVDTGTWSQLPGLQTPLAGFAGPKLVVDHHLTQENWADLKLVETRAAAAGEIVQQLLHRMGVIVDTPIATALFLAIASDTGWFQFSNTRPETFRLAAELMEAGVDTDRMYQRIYQNERAPRLSLQARAMQSMRLLSGGRVAVMSIAKRDFADTGAAVPDTENLINIPLQVATVQVSILASEQPEGGPIRVSLRSKGQLDVAALAEQFGGGGHARASGCKLEGSLESALQRVADEAIGRLGDDQVSRSPVS